MLNLYNIFMLAEAEAAADTTAGPLGSGSWMTLVMLGIVVVIFYMFIYRPQKKQEKEVSAMRNSLEVGDEITTTGGIIGKIISIKEETVMIETGNDKTKIRLLRSAIKNIDVKAADAE